MHERQGLLDDGVIAPRSDHAWHLLLADERSVSRPARVRMKSSASISTCSPPAASTRQVEKDRATGATVED
jgi:hypothetical protein